MSDQENDTTVEDKEEQAPLQPAAWIGGMLPFYIAPDGIDLDVAIQQIQEQGFQIFYILGERKTVTETKKGAVKTSTTNIAPAIFKVTKNLAGGGVTQVSSGTLGLAELEPSAYFNLPGIPWSLVCDVDDFFRSVHDEHGTEAVVIFTYDDRYRDTDKPEDGWGVVVPEQTNTAGSCDYKPESIVEQLPDEGMEHIWTVGTAHSHPGMSAYCSGTDKADQAHFDGIHITYGWKANSGQTEFHIELQMGGSQYSLPEEYAFSGRPDFNKNERIADWKKHVKKKETKTYNSFPYQGSGTPYSGGKTSSPVSSGKRFEHLPKGLPEPSGSVLIVVKTGLSREELKDCVVCNEKLGDYAKKSAKCTSCQSYMMTKDMETIQDLVDYRDKNNIKTIDLDMDDEKAWKDVYLWEEVGTGKDSHDEITKLRTGRSQKKA